MSLNAIPSSLLPRADSHPYYIVAPKYVRTSAGIKALHLLVHWLNAVGRSAFVCIYPEFDGLQVNPDFRTPVLDQTIVDFHFEQGRTPIVLYPEVIDGNPLGAAVIVRFFGNYAGLLGGSSSVSEAEIPFGYSSYLAALAGHPANVLHIPVVDMELFRPADAPRHGTCYHAFKFKHVHKGEPFGLPEGCVEILRDHPDQQSPEEIADIFRRSELFYCFEDSSLMNEAALCGCPVVMMQNAFFTRPLAREEVGTDGYAWGDGEAEIARAKATVSKAYDNYARNIPKFFVQLDQMIQLTQARAAATPYLEPVVVPTVNALLRSRLAEALLAGDRGASPAHVPACNDASAGPRAVWKPEWAMMGAALPVELRAGWSAPDPGGAWSIGPESSLAVHPSDVRRPYAGNLEAGAVVRLRFRAFAEAGRPRAYRFHVAGIERVHMLSHDEAVVIDVSTAEVQEEIVVRISCEAARSPAEQGHSDDPRKLGLYLLDAMAEPAPDVA